MSQKMESSRVFVKEEGTWRAASGIWTSTPGNQTQLRHFMRTTLARVPDTAKDIFIGEREIIGRAAIPDEDMQRFLAQKTVRASIRDWARRKFSRGSDGMYRPAGPIRSDSEEVRKRDGVEDPPESVIISGRENARREMLGPWDVIELRGTR